MLPRSGGQARYRLERAGTARCNGAQPEGMGDVQKAGRKGGTAENRWGDMRVAYSQEVLATRVASELAPHLRAWGRRCAGRCTWLSKSQVYQRQSGRWLGHQDLEIGREASTGKPGPTPGRLEASTDGPWAGQRRPAGSHGVQFDGHHGDIVHHPVLLLQPLGPRAVHQLRGRGRRAVQGGGVGGGGHIWRADIRQAHVHVAHGMRMSPEPGAASWEVVGWCSSARHPTRQAVPVLGQPQVVAEAAAVRHFMGRHPFPWRTALAPCNPPCGTPPRRPCSPPQCRWPPAGREGKQRGSSQLVRPQQLLWW